MIEHSADARRFGVLIAASSFPDEPKLADLSCPENDVDGLFEALDSDVGGNFTELRVVKNEPSHSVLRSIHKVLRQAERDDLVLIYYAGHGKLDRAGRLHLATTDTVNDELETTSIPAQRIRDLIDNATTKKTALILDCCYSGAIEKSFLRGGVDDEMNLLAGGRGTFIMTASTGVQTAREEIADGYGVFTKHVIDGIRGGADSDGDGVITMNELYGYVHRHVPGESHQVPMKWDLNVQGELVIARTGQKPREERRQTIRARLFALAEQGTIPDVVLSKALDVVNMPFEQTRTGTAARYDALLDRLLAEDVRIGAFVDEWLKVPPDDSPRPDVARQSEAARRPDTASRPEAKPEPNSAHADQEKKPKKKPDRSAFDQAAKSDPQQGDEEPDIGWFWKFMVFPYRATQENLNRHPLYVLTRFLAGKAAASPTSKRSTANKRLAAAAQVANTETPGSSKTTSGKNWITALLWLLAEFPAMAVLFTVIGVLGTLLGAAGWIVLGLHLRKQADPPAGWGLNLVYLLGFGFAILMIIGVLTGGSL